MTQEPPDHIEPDPALDRLVRAASQLEPEGDLVLDEATLANYVLGTATPEEKAQVQAALLQSARLREELIHHLRDVEAVLIAATAAETAAVEMPAIPSYAAVEGRIPAAPVKEKERDRPVLVQTTRRPTTVHWWDRLLTPQLGWGLAAAAAIGFVFLMTSRDGIRRLPVAAPTIVRIQGAEVFDPLSRGETESAPRLSHLEGSSISTRQVHRVEW